MAANFNFSLGFNVEKDGINKAKQELANLRSEVLKNPAKFNLEVGDLQESMQKISVFENALKKAFNPNLGKLNTKEFMNQLHAAGYSLEEMREQFRNMGIDARQSLASIDRSLNSTGLSIKKTSKLVESMVDTFANTLKWNIASQAIHGIEGSIARAIGFTKELDGSLNNIQVVTNKSSEEMKVFAQSANDAARALGKTTIEYSDASLIFFQQGKSAKEVRELTRATLVGSTITGESVKDTSELLTAALNGFNLTADKSMLIMDKFAAVGAGTGSDFNELAVGFSKVASMAKTAGVSVDQLNGMLATVSTVTREAPESIGTSFKTILARMDDLQAGKKDEDGWQVGKAQKAMKMVDMSLLTSEGHIRDMGEVIEEVGSKWNTFSKEDQLGVSVALAGSRQQNRMLALFNNWDMYQAALKMSQDAEGTALEQNLIRMDSIEYKSKQLRAAMEEMWMKIVNSDSIKSVIGFLTKMTDGASGFIKVMGGIGPVLAIIGATMTRIMSNKIGNNVVNAISSFKNMANVRSLDRSLMNPSNPQANEASSKEEKRLKQELLVRKYLGEEEHKQFKQSQKALQLEETKLELMQKEMKKQQDIYELIYKNNNAKREEEKRAIATETNKNRGAMSALARFNDGGAQISPSQMRLLGNNGRDGGAVDNAFLNSIKGETDGMKKLNEVLAQNIEDLRLRRQAIIDNQNATDGKAHEALAQQVTDTAVARDVDGSNMESLASRAGSVGKVQKAVAIASAVTMASIAAVSALRAFNEAGDDSQEKAKAVAAGLGGIGASLMAIPHPATMVIGSLLTLGAAILPMIDFTSDLQKAMKANEEMMTRYAKTVGILRQSLTDVLSLQGSYQKFQDMAKSGGISTMSDEDSSEYYGMMEKMAALYPELISYLDKEGRVIVNLNKSFAELGKKQNDKIKAQNDILVANKDSFTFEYTANTKLTQQGLALNKIKLEALELKKRDAIKSGDTKELGNVSSEMAELEKTSDTFQQTLQDMPGKINMSIVQPFLNSHNAVGDLDSSIKSLISTVWNYDSVSEIMKKDTVSAQKELENLESEANFLAGTFILMDEKAKKGDKSSSAAVQKLKDLAPATAKMVIQSILALPIAEDQVISSIERVTQKMTEMKSNVLKRPLTLDDIIDFKDPKQLKALEGRGKFLKDEIAKLETEVASGSENLSSAKINRQQAIGATVDDKRETAKVSTDENEKIEAIVKLNKATDEKLKRTKQEAKDLDEITARKGPGYISFLNQMEEAYSNEIDEMSNSIEGYNQLVDIYDEQTKSLGGLMDVFENLPNQGEEMQSLFDIISSGAELSGDSISSLGSQLQALGEPLEQLKTMFPDLESDITEVMTKGADAGPKAIQNIASAMDSSRSRMNDVFLALNKDNTGFFNTFKKTEKDKVLLAAQSLGVIAENYTTYAEYEEAIKQASFQDTVTYEKDSIQAKSHSVTEKSKMESRSAADSIGREIKLAQDKMDTEVGFVDGYADLQIAKSKASKLASLEGQRAGIASDIAIMANMVETLSSNKGTWDFIFNHAENAAYNESKKNLTMLEAKLSSVDKVIEGVKNSSDSVISAGGSTAAGRKIQGIDIDEYKPMGSGGGTVYKEFTTPKKRSLPEKPEGGKVGDSSDSDKGKKDKVVENMEFDPDELHDTNVLLGTQEVLMKKLKEEESVLYGKAKQMNLDRQNSSLVEKNKILNQQLEILRNLQKTEQANLGKQGVKFNTDGTVANYNAIIQAKVNSANSIKDPEGKEAAIKEVKKFMEDLKNYETVTLKTTIDKEQAIDEVNKAIHEINIKKFEYKITVQIELSKDQEDILTFIKQVNNEFDGISTKYELTMSQVNTKLGEMAAIQEHINRILEDTSLTEKERIEGLDKYEKLMQSCVLDAKKLQDELVKLNADGLKGGLDLLDKQLNRYETIGKTLDHIANMIKLTGNQGNFGGIDKIYEAQEKSLRGQLDGLLSAKELLKDMLATQEKGSKEWDNTNDQLTKMDSQIQKITEQTLKTFQDEFNNSFTSIIDKLDKAMSGGMGMDKLKTDFAKMKSDGDKYLSTQEKIIWAGNMQYKLQQQIDKSTNPATKKKLLEFQNIELANLKKKDILTKYDVERAQKMYDVTQAQILLDEARNNKTIQRLVRDSSGNWSYQYVEDSRKVSDAQEDLSKVLRDLMDYDKKSFLENQEEMIAAKETFLKKMQTIMKNAQNNEYANEAEFQSALASAQKDFNDEVVRLQRENDGIRQNSSESTMAAILDTYIENGKSLDVLTATQKELLESLGLTVDASWESIREALKVKNSGSAEDYKALFTDIVLGHSTNMTSELASIYEGISGAWDSTTGLMGGNNITLAEVVATTISGIRSSWSEYQAKVDEVSTLVGEDIRGLIEKTTELDTETSNVSVSTGIVLKQIEEQWQRLGQLIAEYQKLNGSLYDPIIGAAINYIKNLDDIIRKQKEIATGVNTPAATPPPAPAPATPPPAPAPSGPTPEEIAAANAKALAAKNATLIKGGAVKVKSGRTWYHDSEGKAPSGPTTPYANTQLYITNTANGQYAVGKSTNINSSLGWVKKEDLVGFRTGGYTGEFGNDGKMAMLHEKELVLNKADTSNILEAVKIVRDYASMIKQLIGDGISGTLKGAVGDIQQTVQINADFSGVKSSFEIEKAFANLSNRATQFAQRK